jgi:epoxyqueuosine reductase QueG
MFLAQNSTNQKYLESKGLNILRGFVPQHREFEHILKNCRSVVVIANGGSHLFECFVEELKQNPHYLSSSDHPFDDFIERTVKDIPLQETNILETYQKEMWVMCSQQSSTHINFMSLAKRSGIGMKSHLGILVHPKYGLWIGLRAALFSTQTLKEIGIVETSVSPSKNPCTDCSKPCIQACHYQAINEFGWDMKTCAKGHLLDDKCTIDPNSSCFSSCDARRACPIGLEFQHSDLQHNYHYHRPSGRKRLAKMLKIQDERSGDGPYWEWVFSKNGNQS